MKIDQNHELVVIISNVLWLWIFGKWNLK